MIAPGTVAVVTLPMAKVNSIGFRRVRYGPLRKGSSSGTLQLLFSPFVDTHAFALGSTRYRSMNCRVHTQDEFSGKRTFRVLTSLFAEGKVLLHGVGKLPLELSNGSTLEIDNVADVDHSAVKTVVLLVCLDAGDIALVFQRCHCAFPVRMLPSR